MPWRPPVALIAVVTVLGFLVVDSAESARRTSRASAPRRAQLARLIDSRRSQVADLEAAVRQLRQQVLSAESRAADQGRASSDAARGLALLQLQAGTTAVRGPGLTVEVRDSARTPAATDDAGAYRIHDSDIQLLVNALFGAGAEAVAVNGSRLVATSPIRAAGQTIVVNFRPLTPPYRIVAVGADRRRFAATAIAGRFSHWTSQYGLGFDVRTGTVTAAGFAGPVTISSATPQGSG